METTILTEVHPDHRAQFLPTARPELVWYGTDREQADAVLLKTPRPATLTKAGDGSFAVWCLVRPR